MTSGEFGDSVQVNLGFETSEDLGDLTSRLRRAGYEAQLVPTPAVHVTDPDGRRLEIHPMPR